MNVTGKINIQDAVEPVFADRKDFLEVGEEIMHSFVIFKLSDIKQLSCILTLYLSR